MVYPVTKRLLPILLKPYVKEIRGMDNIPKGTFVMASNHESYIDSVLLASIIVRKTNKKVHYIAIAKLFRSGLRKLIWVGWAGCIPAYFDERKALTIKEAVDKLKEGIVGIFPEGPKKNARLKKGKTGVVRIALSAKVPILPVGLKNTYKILPMEKWIPRIYKRLIKVNIGKPLYLDYSKKHDKKALRRITDKLMKKILVLKNEI